MLAITGTNGKTTVTALTGALCEAAGLTTCVAGNIGEAVLDVLAAVRSGRRGVARRVRPRAFELPARDDVVAAADRRGRAQREREPSRPLCGPRRLRGREGAHLRGRRRAGGQPRRRAQLRDAHSRAARSSRSAPAFPRRKANGASSASTARRGSRTAAGSWCRSRRLSLVGRHNALNALAALALVSTIARINRNVLDALKEFEGLPHRMQRIAEAGRVVFIDDSKATTVVATQAALDGIERAGGAHRRRRRQGPGLSP